jgi:hypothetical protein
MTHKRAETCSVVTAMKCCCPWWYYTNIVVDMTAVEGWLCPTPDSSHVILHQGTVLQLTVLGNNRSVRVVADAKYVTPVTIASSSRHMWSWRKCCWSLSSAVVAASWSVRFTYGTPRAVTLLASAGWIRQCREFHVSLSCHWITWLMRLVIIGALLCVCVLVGCVRILRHNCCP